MVRLRHRRTIVFPAQTVMSPMGRSKIETSMAVKTKTVPCYTAFLLWCVSPTVDDAFLVPRTGGSACWFSIKHQSMKALKRTPVQDEEFFWWKQSYRVSADQLFNEPTI
ncbi:hypothetical protein XENORESO_013148 [Xenotaenia resolanae]|uniref:Uncharacterized protein n=1 Tax=Xenotaenia resolanae TaxID=208358 RepID=A0ABV0W4W0_9TELE